MSWLGLDIGGANLKVANETGWACSMPFALWRNPSGLTAALAELVMLAPAFDRLAVTMTGELCDCYRSKSEGVSRILASVCEIVAERKVAVYLTDGRFASISAALETPLLAAASNWRAIAELACRYVTGTDALLIDVGSTTTDIIPIVNRQVAAQGRTDTERLLAGELVYSGVGRTPICALAQSLPLRGELCPVAAELFATTADAYVLLGDWREDPLAGWTADGRPLTAALSRERLARQVCADVITLSEEEVNQMAAFVRASQQSQLAKACRRVAGRLQAAQPGIVIAGEGEFLARAVAAEEIPGSPIASLADQAGMAVSQSAAAYALAVLAEGAIF
ncbi:MAG TPA: hydantoinase/oxoprolinase family protein [Lacipirellulaceae bacterium]|nr:hydantoinase/oxoprolinase family protein [Lacipirellulaceae bacterium]